MGILKRKRIIEIGERNWKRWSDEMRCYDDDDDDVSLSCKSIADRDLSKRYVELIERRIGACGAHSIQLSIEIDTHTLTLTLTHKLKLKLKLPLTLTQQLLSWVDQGGLSFECIGFQREPDDHRLFPVIIELLLTDLCLCLCLCVCLCLCCVFQIFLTDRSFVFFFFFLLLSFYVFFFYFSFSVNYFFYLYTINLYIYNIFSIKL